MLSTVSNVFKTTAKAVGVSIGAGIVLGTVIQLCLPSKKEMRRRAIEFNRKLHAKRQDFIEGAVALQSEMLNREVLRPPVVPNIPINSNVLNEYPSGYLYWRRFGERHYITEQFDRALDGVLSQEAVPALSAIDMFFDGFLKNRERKLSFWRTDALVNLPPRFLLQNCYLFYDNTNGVILTDQINPIASAVYYGNRSCINRDLQTKVSPMEAVAYIMKKYNISHQELYRTWHSYMDYRGGHWYLNQYIDNTLLEQPQTLNEIIQFYESGKTPIKIDEYSLNMYRED